MKILHFADLHIKLAKYHSEYREALKHLLRIIDEEKVEVVVFVGDFFHNKLVLSPDAIQLGMEYLRGIADKCPLYLIAGQHDLNLNNSSRLDAISPLVESLNHPNIHYMKSSGDYPIEGHSGFSFNVRAITDSNYLNPVNPGIVNITLFHGMMKNCSTETGWVTTHGEDVSFFDGCDYVFLGDLHQTQSIGGVTSRFYAGSLLQQSHGESVDKGVLIWDIKDKKDFTVKRVLIPTIHPYITIELNSDGTLPKRLKIPKEARIRLMSDANIPVDKLHHALDVVKAKYNPESISFMSKNRKPLLGCLDDELAEEDNLRDPTVQEKYIREYLAPTEAGEETIQKVLDLNQRYNKAINLDDDIERGVRWNLERLEWENLYNFGGNNYIDFTKLSGVVGILAGNFQGKSSTIDACAYTMYNTSFKNSKKAMNIVNQNKDFGSGIATVRVGNDVYKIDRRSDKYTKKLKNVETTEAKTTVNFYKQIGDEEESLNGQDRNETDKNIRRIFGTLDDFLLTSFSSQHGALSYINEGSTKRKEILARFLDLQTLEEKFRLAKEDASGLKASLKRFEDKDYVTDIAKAEVFKEDCQESIVAHDAQLADLRNKLESTKERLTECRVRLSNYSLTPFIDIDEVSRQKVVLESQIGKLDAEIVDLDVSIKQNQELLTKIQDFLREFVVEEHEGKLNNAKTVRDSIDSVSSQIQKLESDIKLNEKKSKLLSEVPCGPEFSSCKFIKDAYGAVDHLPEFKEELDRARENKKKLEETIDQDDLQKSREYIEKYKKILEKRSSVQTSLMRESSLMNKKEEESRQKKSLFDKVDSQIAQYNQSSKEQKEMKFLMESIEGLEEEVVDLQSDVSDTDKKYKSQLEALGSVTQQIKTLTSTREEMLQLRKEYSAYELFMRCMHANGISYQIIKKKLPVINAEIARVLTSVADFEVFFVDEEDKLELFIKHPAYDPRVIEMGSGAEKSLAAMAIRLALFTVSTLPRSDFMVLDEPAVDLDPEMMQAFIRILELLRGNFRLILLISHLDTLKDSVDMQIPIEKVNGYARIQI